MTSDVKFSLATGPLPAVSCDLWVVGVFAPATGAKSGAAKTGKKKNAAPKNADFSASDLASQLGELDEALDGKLSSIAFAEGFRANKDQTFQMHTLGQIGAQRVLLVGLGKAEGIGVDDFRKLGGKSAREANARKNQVVLLQLPEVESIRPEVLASAAAEGVLLGSYRFDRYLTENKEGPSLQEVMLCSPLHKNRLRQAMVHAQAVAEGVSLARDLVNECAGALTPVEFAKTAKRVGKSASLDVQVLTEKELAKEKMGLMLAVAQAAQPYTPPRLVRLHYKPSGKAKKKVCLVGKGLTFDSGGLDIKPAAGMLDMKIDMAGAAAVLGTMLTIGRLKPDVEVIGYLGCVENGIGGNAYHPGDILISRKGLSVEVNNTDAEGRLVLADCIDYALTQDRPDTLIDLATLTGACMIALGPYTAGLFTADDALAEDIRHAGAKAGEDFWRLPLNADLMVQLKSNIADLRNTGERAGGAITAALFLQKFVDDRAQWVHVDLAAPSLSDRDQDYTPKGGAGFGVRTLAGILAPQ